jgi:hypothetical protein
MRSALGALVILTALQALAALRPAHATDTGAGLDYGEDSLFAKQYTDDTGSDSFTLDDLDYSYEFDDVNLGLGGADDAFNYYGDEMDEYYDNFGIYADGGSDYTFDKSSSGTDEGDCHLVGGKANLTGAHF